MKNLILPLIFSTLCMFSCSEKLDRDKAKTLIEEELKIYQATARVPHNKTPIAASQLPSYNKLVEDNMITLEYSGRTKGIISHNVYNIQLTPEGKKHSTNIKYNSNKYLYMKAADKKLLEVTGIQEIEDDKIAKVDYTWHFTNITPFGKFYNHNHAGEKLQYNGKTESSSIIMVKYDDGWRIKE